MNKEELSQISSLKKEIALLEKQINNVKYTVYPELGSDSVKGSSRHFPYTEHSIKITGTNYKGYKRKVKILTNELKARRNELINRISEINKYIESIPNSDVRMIVQCKYIDGLTWDEIEKELYMHKRTAQMKLKAWLSKKK